jgi:hypothetical protein
MQKLYTSSSQNGYRKLNKEEAAAEIMNMPEVQAFVDNNLEDIVSDTGIKNREEAVNFITNQVLGRATQVGDALPKPTYSGGGGSSASVSSVKNNIDTEIQSILDKISLDQNALQKSDSISEKSEGALGYISGMYKSGQVWSKAQGQGKNRDKVIYINEYDDKDQPYTIEYNINRIADVKKLAKDIADSYIQYTTDMSKVFKSEDEFRNYLSKTISEKIDAYNRGQANSNASGAAKFNNNK